MHFTSLTLYDILAQSAKADSQDGKLSFLQVLKASLIAKGVASFISLPFEVVLLRIQTDNLLDKNQRRNYQNFSSAFKTIFEQEKFQGLFKGGFPSVIYRTAQTFSLFLQIATNSTLNAESKHWTKYFTPLISGAFLLGIYLPFDNIRVKYQHMLTQQNVASKYSGFTDCLIKSIKKEGILGLYAGFSVAYCRHLLFYPTFYLFSLLMNNN